jgi:VanZ family protein
MPRPGSLGWALATVAVSVAYWAMGLQPSVPEALSTVSDDVVHAVAYALLAGLAAMAAATWPLPLPSLLGGAWAVGHGFLLEVMQRFSPPRAAELSDLAADAVGACGGAALVWLATRRRP